MGYWRSDLLERAPKDRAFLAFVPRYGGWVVVDPRMHQGRSEITFGWTRPQNYPVRYCDVLAIDDLPALPRTAG